MGLASGQSLAWHRVPFPVYTRHVASQADGQGPLSYTQCIQQINFDKNSMDICWLPQTQHSTFQH